MCSLMIEMNIIYIILRFISLLLTTPVIFDAASICTIIVMSRVQTPRKFRKLIFAFVFVKKKEKNIGIKRLPNQRK